MTGLGAATDAAAVEYLSVCDAVDDGLQCFMRVTLEDPLHPADSGSNGLLHGHVQVVVVFLCSEVLKDRHRTVATLEYSDSIAAFHPVLIREKH